MHKKVSSDKRGRTGAGSRSPDRGSASRHNAGSVKSGAGQPDSVKNLLARANPVLASIARRLEVQDSLEAWVRRQLPTPLAEQVTEVLEKEGELTVFAASAAWAGRLRYALETIKPELARAHPRIATVRIKVMPRGGRP